MGIQRATVVLAAAALLTLSSAAIAEPAGESSFLPIGLSATEPSVVVTSGDHLWKISQSHLDRVLGRPATVDEVVAYWRSVIEANRERLQSGDPDLIYPGEVVLLPASG